MKQRQLLASLTCAALAWIPLASADGLAAGASDRMTPQERKLTAHVSRALFATHAAERAEAARLGLADLETELRELRRAVEALALAEARAEIVSALPSGGAGAAGAGRAAHRAGMNASLSRLAAKRAALEAELPALRSERQRHLVRRALQKLAELEQEVRDAAAAPAGERVQRLAGVKERLVLERFGLSQPQPADAPSPTFQMVPEDRLPRPAED